MDLRVETPLNSQNQQGTGCFWDYGINHVNHDRTETLREKNTPNNNTNRQRCRLGGAVLASVEGQKVALKIAAFPVITQNYWKSIRADLRALIMHFSLAQGHIGVPEAT